MRIERIDDKTVKCFLSNEELEEYDIDYKDFILRSEKAKEIVQEIIEQAVQEVGYKPPKFAFDLQIMMVPEQGLVLTLSEKDQDMKDGEQLIECLKEMKRIFQKAKDKEPKAENPQETAQKQADAKKEKEQIQRPDFAVFGFSGLRNAMEYTAVLPANLRVESQLYKTDDLYYLFLWKGHTSYERFSRACIQALEFGALYTAEEDKAIHIKEHGICLIEEKAVKKLRGCV